MKLYLGCPVWSYKGWVGSFYPEGTKSSAYLREYSRRLNTVEGNTTFYAVPSADTIARWVEETPESFRFCLKLPRSISHAGRLQPHIQDSLDFITAVSELGDRLGPMFLQLPPRYPPSLLSDLRAFLQAWPAGVKLAVEVRHLDWFDTSHQERLEALLSDLDLARVVIDTRPIRTLSGDKILDGSVYKRMLEARQRKPDLPLPAERVITFPFLRYIGHPLMQQNQAYIQEWAEQLAAYWHTGSTEAYIFCHSPDERVDPWLCREFHSQVSEHIPIQALPWDDIDTDIARQARLF
jgi:uncharacterized protein YecE (DUF72 family)